MDGGGHWTWREALWPRNHRAGPVSDQEEIEMAGGVRVSVWCLWKEVVFSQCKLQFYTEFSLELMLKTSVLYVAR